MDRYPDLRTHPSLPSVVKAFENLNQVITGALDSKSNPMKAELQRREKLELDPADLAASGAVKRTMTPAERAEFRVQAILGQTPEQVDAARNARPDDKSGIPDVYKKVAQQQKKTANEEVIVDEGNVFTRPSKGSESQRKPV